MNTEYTNSRTAIDRQLLAGQEVPLGALNAYVFGFAFLKA